MARVYEELPDVIAVLSPKHFETGDMIPIGFRKWDVFRYDDQAKKMLASGVIRWEMLRPFARER